MKMVLDQNEIGEAIIGFLSARGVDVSADQIYLEASRPDALKGWIFKATISNVDLPPKDGPYR